MLFILKNETLILFLQKTILRAREKRLKMEGGEKYIFDEIIGISFGTSISFHYLCSRDKNIKNMDVALQTVNLQLPVSDMQFLRDLAKRMGWIAKKVTSSSKMNELDKAILDVKRGNVKGFDTVEDMMAYLEV